jgi:pilus assembly protein Flp/PilA
MHQRNVARKGSVLVEYALLIAGIALVSVVAVAVLGHKIQHGIGVQAAILPSAHADDNKPIQHFHSIPFHDQGGKLVLNATELANPAGVDRLQGILGPTNGPGTGGELLISD